ncbi:excalibur calcium-binding domain-containing protein [Arthrobacter sp. UYEF20]|uniref:excalibur calcium-binding domain-containing protein n=1 Tax=Arthrobacter sp. UYEF20 TaxID=1756363 RepID=UPI0033928977
MKKVFLASLATAALLLTVSAVPANAAPSPRSYKNCAELNKVYPHGVGKSGARDKTSGKPVTTFRANNTVYSYNDGGANRHTGEYDLDRDNDGIACEKR